VEEECVLQDFTSMGFAPGPRSSADLRLRLFKLYVRSCDDGRRVLRKPIYRILADDHNESYNQQRLAGIASLTQNNLKLSSQ
jgi:hypothetical protein